MSRISSAGNILWSDIMNDDILIKKLQEENILLKNKIINNEKKNKKKNVCHICLEEPEVPVWLNGFNLITNNFESCQSSQSSTSCLRCIRSEMDSVIKSGNYIYKCWSGCHLINLNSNKKWIYYGEMNRDPNSVPCPALYRMMDNNNIGVTKCRLCNTQCDGVFDLATHIKKSCLFLKIKCKVCKKMIRKNDIDEHNKTCYRVCGLCSMNGIEVKVDINDTSDTRKNKLTNHLCKYKKLATCKVCQKEITIFNISSHNNCAILKNNDLNTVCIPVTSYRI
tara:strand:- start:4725 stop:5564 length:840 start_codon:yes stop_codon:yes gene_type:complete